MTEAPKKLWTPDQKVPESVRKMAFLFFMEVFRSYLTKPPETRKEIKLGDEYRSCLGIAKKVHEIDAENDEPKP